MAMIQAQQPPPRAQKRPAAVRLTGLLLCLHLCSDARLQVHPVAQPEVISLVSDTDAAAEARATTRLGMQPSSGCSRWRGPSGCSASGCAAQAAGRREYLQALAAGAAASCSALAALDAAAALAPARQALAMVAASPAALSRVEALSVDVATASSDVDEASTRLQSARSAVQRSAADGGMVRHDAAEAALAASLASAAAAYESLAESQRGRAAVVEAVIATAGDAPASSNTDAARAELPQRRRLAQTALRAVDKATSRALHAMQCAAQARGDALLLQREAAALSALGQAAAEASARVRTTCATAAAAWTPDVSVQNAAAAAAQAARLRAARDALQLDARERARHAATHQGGEGAPGWHAALGDE
jgi:hypothetical protein